MGVGVGVEVRVGVYVRVRVRVTLALTLTLTLALTRWPPSTSLTLACAPPRTPTDILTGDWPKAPTDTDG